MKRLIIFLFVWMMCTAVFAQSPLMLNYSTVVRNAAGNPLLNQSVSFRMTILSGSVTGSVMYEETHSVSTDAFGTVSLQIGGGSVISGSMASANWSGAPNFLKVELDITGGTNYVNMGTTQLLSVPYALYANQAGVAGGSQWNVSADDIYNTNNGNVGIGILNPPYKLSVKQGLTDNDTIPLFEVKNNIGQTVFVIYPDSVRFYIEDDGVNKGAFVISSRNFYNNATSDLLYVSPDSIRMYQDTTMKCFRVNRRIGNYPVHVGTNITNGNGAFLTAGGIWTNSSSREFKDRFKYLPGQEILDKIAAMDVQGWYYKGTDEFHICPVAEDFYAAFGCGSPDVSGDLGRYISPSDVSGVTLLAVQELLKTLNEEKQQKQILRVETDAVKVMMMDIEARVENLESKTE